MSSHNKKKNKLINKENYLAKKSLRFKNFFSKSLNFLITNLKTKQNKADKLTINIVQYRYTYNIDIVYKQSIDIILKY